MTAFNDIGTYTQFVKRAFTNETVKDKVVYDASMKYIRAHKAILLTASDIPPKRSRSLCYDE